MNTKSSKTVKTTKIFTTGGFLAALTLGTLAVTAAGPLANHSGLGLGAGPRSWLGKGLSADQRDQMHAVLAQHQPTIEPLVRQFIDEHREVRDAIQEGPRNARRIRAEIDETAAVGADLAVAHAYVVQDLKPILTPAQRERFLEADARVETTVDQLLASDWTEIQDTLAAWPGPGILRERLQERKTQVIDELGLTEDQLATIQTAVANRQAELRPVIAQLVEHRRELKALYRAETVDEDAIRATVAQIAEIRKELAVKGAGIRESVTYSFTPDQLAKLESFEQRVENRVDAVVDFVFNWIAS